MEDALLQRQTSTYTRKYQPYSLSANDRSPYVPQIQATISAAVEPVQPTTKFLQNKASQRNSSAPQGAADLSGPATVNAVCTCSSLCLQAPVHGEGVGRLETCFRKGGGGVEPSGPGGGGGGGLKRGLFCLGPGFWPLLVQVWGGGILEKKIHSKKGQMMISQTPFDEQIPPMPP